MNEQSFWVMWIRVTMGLGVLVAMSMRYWFTKKAREAKPDSHTPVLWVSVPAICMNGVFFFLMAWVVVYPEFFIARGLMLQPYFSPLTHWMGTALAVFALYLFYSVHRALGDFWNLNVSLKPDHKIIDSGPYGFVRHPMYSTYFIAFFGAALLIQSLPLLYLFLPFWSAYFFMARREEILFGKHFGKAYEKYSKRTGMFIPRVSSLFSR